MATQDLIDYYANLLIMQSVGRPKAYASMQTWVTPGLMPQSSVQALALSAVPAGGAFTLSWGGGTTAAIAWNDAAATIQAKLTAVAGLAAVTVTGSLAGQAVTVAFNQTGVQAPAPLLTVAANTLVDAGSAGVTATVGAVDLTLPLALLAAFDLTGPTPAVGAQLDMIGKYVGVKRTGPGFGGVQLTLNDTDYLTLIKLGIARNTLKGTLAAIQAFIAAYFPSGELRVFDHRMMRMSYLINSSIGSQALMQLVIQQGLLPKPMGVQRARPIYAPVTTTFFGYRTYAAPATNVSPFNTYASYAAGTPWLSYANAL